ncbi:MAG: type II toxin-antitoxin system Phd/YefM family antitoxin [Actinomycetota bacterium]|nr:type II toxin-antitoxin system Phd/YefM family antitoxin [Actinomycetota bacterium]
MATISSREFNQDVSAAKRAASREPVVITDRGRPSHVLLSIQEYQRLVADQRTIVEWLSVDDDIDLCPGRVELSLTAPDL